MNAPEGMFDIPSCDSCEHPAVILQEYSGRVLCNKHLAKSVRKKISRELRQQFEIEKGVMTTIFVAISGGKDSAVLLDSLVDILGQRRDVKIIAGTVDEGIEGYRPPSLICAEELCKKLDVEFVTVSYRELQFMDMDDVVKKLPMVIENDNDAPRMPCAYCGVFRRQGINYLASKVGADVVALGHNLDDMAQTVLMNLTNGDIERTLRLAPHTTTPLDGMAPRIVPLRWVPEQEIHLYALHRNLPIHHEECPHARGALRWRHRELVARMEEDVAGTRHGLVRAADHIKVMRDQITALGGSPTKLAPPAPCVQCGELTSGNQCKACDMRTLLGIEFKEDSQ